MIPGKLLSWQEQKAIEELHVRIKKDLPASLSGDDLVLYKFLKARDFDVDKAEKMIKKHIHWRKVYQVDTFLEDFKPKDYYMKYVKSSVLGFDKDGHMVLYSPAGTLITKDILRCTTMNDYVRHFIWKLENTKALQKLKSEKEDMLLRLSIFLIWTTLHFQMLHQKSVSRCAESLMKLMSTAQDNYPEFLKTVYLINCPSYYVFAFSFIKPLMSKAMLNKLKFFGQSGWKEEIAEAIGEDVLPAFLGGNRTDPDGNPLCNTFVGHGGMMPENYYLSHGERYFKDPAQVQKTILSANERKEITVQVTENGSWIEWEYLVKSKDVGFGLDFCIAEGKAECILPVEKFSTPDGAEKGFYRCKRVGRYNIIFDNSHSWMTSKEVDYVVKVTKG